MRALCLLLILLAAPAAANTSFALPQGCVGEVTIQKRACTVTNLFRCEGDVDGALRRVDFDDQGMTYAGTIDSETQWLESWHPAAMLSETLQDGAADPASFTALIETGVDTFDFQTLTTPGGFVTRYRGQDRLTGETVVIDGVTLEVTEFAMTALDGAGNVLWRSSGREFISRDLRSFISGTRITVTADGEWSDDNTPVSFIFPGEAGFLSSTPRHDCGVMLSQAPVMLDGGDLLPVSYHRN